MLIRTFSCRIERNDGSKNSFLETARNYNEAYDKVRNYSTVKRVIMIQAITKPYEFDEERGCKL